MIRNLFFDSDLLGDDFFALYGLAANKDIELCGVTTFGRRVAAMERAKMAQVFLEMHGASGIDIVPGSDKPLMLATRKSCTFCDEQMKWLRQEWKEGVAYRSPIIDEPAAAYLAVLRISGRSYTCWIYFFETPLVWTWIPTRSAAAT